MRAHIHLVAVAVFGATVGPEAIGAQALQDPFERSFAGVVNNDQETTSGAAWADWDGDGDLDLFVSAFGNRDNFLYENLGDGSFRRLTSALPGSDAGKSSGAAWADIDNDGLDDLFVANQQGQDNFLYRNLGGGTFERVEGPVQRDRGESYAGAWADYDGDGLVDLFVANRNGGQDFLYRNLGDGGFEGVAEGPVVESRGSTFTAAWADWDGDGLVDLFTVDADRDRPNSLYRNAGGGVFERVEEGPIGVDAATSAKAAWGDYDNDGDLDLYVANGGFYGGTEEMPFFYRNDEGTLVRITSGPPVETAISGSDVAWFDWDDDGDLDLFVAAYRDHNLLFRNDGPGGFTRLTTGWAARHGGFTDAAAVADVDRDGDLDLYLTHWESQNDVLLTNRGNDNHWLTIRLEGTRSNRSAFGATVRATAVIDGREVTQLRPVGVGRAGRGQDAREVHFGLGDAAEALSLTVRWPSGEETRLGPLEADRFLVVREGEGVVSSEPPRTPDVPPSAASAIYGAFASDGVDAAIARYRSLALPDSTRAAGLAVAVQFVFDAVDPERGMVLLSAALEAAPDRPEVVFVAGELNRAVGRMERARDLYRRVPELLEDAEGVDADDARWMVLQSARYSGRVTRTGSTSP